MPAGSPVASFTPTMVGTSRARRSIVVGRDPAAGADRDVVEQDGKPAAASATARKWLVDPGLGRAVVVRRHHQDAVDAARRRRRPGQRDRVGGVVGPGAGDDRDGDGLGHGPPQVGLLVVGEHRALAGGPAHDQAVAAVVRPASGPGRRRRRGRARPPSSNGVTMAVITGPKRAGVGHAVSYQCRVTGPPLTSRSAVAGPRPAGSGRRPRGPAFRRPGGRPASRRRRRRTPRRCRPGPRTR